jgi:hypothetical protein
MNSGHPSAEGGWKRPESPDTIEKNTLLTITTRCMTIRIMTEKHFVIPAQVGIQIMP